MNKQEVKESGSSLIENNLDLGIFINIFEEDLRVTTRLVTILDISAPVLDIALVDTVHNIFLHLYLTQIINSSLYNP